MQSFRFVKQMCNSPGGGGGAALLGILGGGMPTGSQNSDSISEYSKIHPRRVVIKSRGRGFPRLL